MSSSSQTWGTESFSWNTPFSSSLRRIRSLTSLEPRAEGLPTVLMMSAMTSLE